MFNSNLEALFAIRSYGFSHLDQLIRMYLSLFIVFIMKRMKLHIAMSTFYDAKNHGAYKQVLIKKNQKHVSWVHNHLFTQNPFKWRCSCSPRKRNLSFFFQTKKMGLLSHDILSVCLVQKLLACRPVFQLDFSSGFNLKQKINVKRTIIYTIYIRGITTRNLKSWKWSDGDYLRIGASNPEEISQRTTDKFLLSKSAPSDYEL